MPERRIMSGPVISNQTEAIIRILLRIRPKPNKPDKKV